MRIVSALLEPLRTQTVVLESPLRPDEILSRVRDVVYSKTAFTGPVVGYVGANSATIRKRLGYQNSWQSEVKLVPRPQDAGSDVYCICGMRRFARFFMAIQLGFLLLWIFAVLAIAVLSPESFDDPSMSAGTRIAIFVLGGLLILALSWGTMLVCRYIARNEIALLLDFVAHRCEANRQ